MRFDCIMHASSMHVHNTHQHTPQTSRPQAQLDALYEIHEFYFTADKGEKQVRDR